MLKFPYGLNDFEQMRREGYLYVVPFIMSDLPGAYSITLQPEFNSICGFTEIEVVEMVQTIAEERNLPLEKFSEALSMMCAFYDGYCFSLRGTDHVYHPNLVFHCLRNLEEQDKCPLSVQDSNWGDNSIVYPADLGNSEEMVAALLDETAELTTSSLARCFSVADILNPDKKSVDYLAAQLYYQGVLTLVGVNELRAYVLTFPNQVTRDYIRSEFERLVWEQL